MWWHMPSCILGFLHVFVASGNRCHLCTWYLWDRLLSGFFALDHCYVFWIVNLFGTWDYLLNIVGVSHLRSMRSSGSVSYTIEIRQLDVNARCTSVVVLFILILWLCLVVIFWCVVLGFLEILWDVFIHDVYSLSFSYPVTCTKDDHVY